MCDAARRSYRTPRHDDLRRPPKGRVGRIVDVAGARVIGHQQAHGGPTDLARQLDPVPRIDDRPGVHDRHRRRDLIDLPPLKEERPQFGEEERKRWLTSICGRSDSICEKSGL